MKPTRINVQYEEGRGMERLSVMRLLEGHKWRDIGTGFQFFRSKVVIRWSPF